MESPQFIFGSKNRLRKLLAKEGAVYVDDNNKVYVLTNTKWVKVKNKIK